MNIKEVVDKIWVEADIQKNSYPVENALQDVNATIRKLIGKARRIASQEPISNAEVNSEVFTVTVGSNTHTRTIKDIPIFRVDFRVNGSTTWCRMRKDQERGINTWCCEDNCCGVKYFADEKRIFTENGEDGDLRVTYASGEFTPFTLTDYNAGTPPQITWIPEEFQDLIWLYPALRQSRFYKSNRAPAFADEIAQLQASFDLHYARNALWNQKVITNERGNQR